VRKKLVSITAVIMVAAGAATAAAALDWGQTQQAATAKNAEALFGVSKPVPASSTASLSSREANTSPAALATVAKGLKVSVAASNFKLPPNIDMMVLWPPDSPQWIIACNEQGPTDPGLVRISLATGQPATILTGTDSCDPARLTAWGTILFGEEAGGGPEGGRVYELLDPVGTTNVVLDRATGVFSGGTGASNLIARPALGRTSYEGLALYPSGLTYYGNELRPSEGAPGGAYYKFVPDHPFLGGGPITSLSQSPLASGQVYGLRLGLREDATDYGQGTESGLGTWIAVPADGDPDLEAFAIANHLTGYYRPEDLEIDRAEEASGHVRVCGNNTGNEVVDHLWGNTICLTDGDIASASANTAVPEVQLLVVGSADLAMPDNLAYQPGRGNWIIHEDGDSATTGRNNDLFACLDDGLDTDVLSDGCVRVATLNDLTAEWTGGFFSADGKHFFVSVQHNITGHGVILDITGWQ
jgi:hypothetical protein